jgi:hypothetical protein
MLEKGSLMAVSEQSDAAWTNRFAPIQSPFSACSALFGRTRFEHTPLPAALQRPFKHKTAPKSKRLFPVSRKEPIAKRSSLDS